MPDILFAGGLLYVYPPKLDGTMLAVARPAIVSSKTLTTVSDSEIQHEINQLFYNDNDHILDSVYLLPLPKAYETGAQVSINGIQTGYEVLERQDLLSLLEHMTQAANDPSVLSLANDRAIVIRDYKLGVRKQVSIKAVFKIPNTIENGLLAISTPMTGEIYSLAPVEKCEIKTRFKTSHPIRSLFSPSHNIETFRESPTRAMVSVVEESKRVIDDFLLFATFSKDLIDMEALTYKDIRGSGFFILLIAPPIIPPETKPIERDVIFILDTSGSLATWAQEHIRDAVTFGMEKFLLPGDRFNITVVGTKPKRFNENLVLNTEINRKSAIAFVESSQTSGGTDLYNALVNAVNQFSSRKRSPIIVLIGDGRCTVGVTNPETIIEDVSKHNRMKARIFALTLGETQNSTLLDGLTSATKGFAINYRQGDFPETTASFFRGITPPTASNLHLEFSDTVGKLIPTNLPDLHGSENATVVGSIDRVNATQMRLKASVSGKPKEFSEFIDFSSDTGNYPFVGDIAAMRLMYKLLQKEWLKSGDLQSREQIESLAAIFGFAVPSFISRKAAVYDKNPDLDKLMLLYKQSTIPSEVRTQNYRRIGSKIFKTENGIWREVGMESNSSRNTILFGSEEYFQMLRNNPTLGSEFALGTEIDLMMNETPISIRMNK